MAVPWTGFPLAALLELAEPARLAPIRPLRHLPSTRRMRAGPEDALVPVALRRGADDGRGDERARLPRHRRSTASRCSSSTARRCGCVVPWKYGFKSVKSIVQIELSPTSGRRRSGTALRPREYGFSANVNPDVPHPRWSQATERVLGTDERRPTLLYNGYGEFVADLYKDMKGERLWACGGTAWRMQRTVPAACCRRRDPSSPRSSGRSCPARCWWRC